VAGGFTTTKPVAPNNIISVAAVLSSGPNGILLIRPQIGSNINNDEGVKITTPTTGDLLQLQASGLWENKSVNDAGIVTLDTNQTITGIKSFGSNALQVASDGAGSFPTVIRNITSNSLISGGFNHFGFNNLNNIYFSKGSGSFNAGVFAFNNTSTRTYTLPDSTGTLALTSQLHDPVTLGTANGLSLSGQVLSLGLASGSTNGALSSTDWIIFNNKIGGSGTTNYIAKFTASGTVGDSAIFESGGNVGIGTISPVSKLDVNGTGRFTDNLTVNTNATFGADRTSNDVGVTVVGILGSSFDSNSSQLNLTQTWNGAYYPVVLASAYDPSSGPASSSFTISTTTFLGSPITSERMRIVGSNGNVGIGTSSPDSKLQVSGNGTQEILVTNTNTGSLSLRHAVTVATVGTIDNIPLKFDTNSSERMRITATGNVGIGTSSPISSAILDLSSTTRGFLPPRMTTTQRNAIVSPVAGLMIYNTTTNVINVYNGTIWI
jgi:hypothetical protein